MNTDSHFQSADLSLVTTISLFFPVDSVDKTNPRKSVFLFKREHGLDDLIEAYWRKELKIEPQALLSQLKSIKTRLYEN